MEYLHLESVAFLTVDETDAVIESVGPPPKMMAPIEGALDITNSRPYSV